MSPTPRLTRSSNAVAACAILLLSVAVQAQESVHQPIVNGVDTGGFPAVSLLFIDNAQGTGSCTGTLIGCRTILTAAHCVCEGDTAASCSAGVGGIAFLPSGGAQAFANATVHPGYDFPRNDLAVVRLANPISGVAPMPINESAAAGPGVTGLAVGYGLTRGDVGQSGGIKRGGVATLAACPAVVQSTNLCADLEAPLGPAGEDSGICQGDSGGPLLLSSDNRLLVGGVASGVTGNCLPPAQGIWARVFKDRAWIRSVAGGDLDQTRCGNGPQAGEATAPIASVVGTIAGGATQDYTLPVPAGTSLLRVALTHGDGRDVDLRVRRGAAPTPSNFDCRSDFPGLPELCTFANPTAGTWHLQAVGFSGSGQFQLTATSFAPAAAPTGPCVPGAKTLCISDTANDRRFAIEVSFRPPGESPRDGDAIPLSSLGVGRGGLFTFFNPSNPEMLVKVLNGCPVNQRFWTFYAATTNVEFTITVTDTETGRVWTRTNAQGNAAVPVQDTQAFPCS